MGSQNPLAIHQNFVTFRAPFFLAFRKVNYIYRLWRISLPKEGASPGVCPCFFLCILHKKSRVFSTPPVPPKSLVLTKGLHLRSIFHSNHIFALLDQMQPFSPSQREACLSVPKKREGCKKRSNRIQRCRSTAKKEGRNTVLFWETLSCTKRVETCEPQLVGSR